MTTYLGKSCSFCLPRVPFVNCRQFMYLVISLLVLRAGYGIWLYQFLIIAYLFILDENDEFYLGLSNARSYNVHDVIGRVDRFGFQNFCSPVADPYLCPQLRRSWRGILVLGCALLHPSVCLKHACHILWTMHARLLKFWNFICGFLMEK